jgi:16S rRNA (adenine1518-N6/adenine1519-N6)-dimethyltransferase
VHAPRKRFGQNFLRDSRVISQIIHAISPQKGEHVIEIGPGRGAITVPLLACGIDLDVIELDRDLIANLRQLAVPDHASLQVHNADALAFDICALARGGRKLRIAGNLPYNISTPLLFRLIEQRACIHDMHLMLQQEVVDRMAARAGGRDYGRLSIMVQHHCRVQPLFTIGPGAFYPQPKVDSCFVRLTPHVKPEIMVTNEDVFALMVKTAFTHRRKTLRNALRGLASEEMLAAADIDPGLRPEQLELAEYARLSEQIALAREN